jgi:hypothetical protein
MYTIIQTPHHQRVLVVLGLQHPGDGCHGDARFDLRGHQGLGQLPTTEFSLGWITVIINVTETVHFINITSY